MEILLFVEGQLKLLSQLTSDFRFSAQCKKEKSMETKYTFASPWTLQPFCETVCVWLNGADLNVLLRLSLAWCLLYSWRIWSRSCTRRDATKEAPSPWDWGGSDELNWYSSMTIVFRCMHLGDVFFFSFFFQDPIRDTKQNISITFPCNTLTCVRLQY